MSKKDFFSLTSFFLLAIGVLPVIIPLYFVLDRRVQIRVNKAGIWTRWRGLTKWAEIEYFYSTITKSPDNNDTYRLYLSMRKDGWERKIWYRGMTTNFRDVREIIVHYAQQYNIVDQGHTIG